MLDLDMFWKDLETSYRGEASVSQRSNINLNSICEGVDEPYIHELYKNICGQRT